MSNSTSNRKPAADTTAKKPAGPDETAAAEASSDAGQTAGDLKKKELIDLVVARSGVKKKDAKPVIETMLAVLGETIAQERGLALQPLGKLRVTRTEDKDNGRIFVCKLRRTEDAPRQFKDPLAATAE